MEYGRLVVLGYSSYRVGSASSAASSSSRSITSIDASKKDELEDAVRSPRGVIAQQQQQLKKLDKDRRAIGQLWEPIGDQNAEYVLTQRKRGNGVTLRRFHHFMDARFRDPETDMVTPAGKADLKTVTRRMLHAIEIRNKALEPSTLQQQQSSHSSSSDDEGFVLVDDDDVVSVASSSSATTSSPDRKQDALPRTASSSSASSAASCSSSSVASTSYLMCIPMNDADAHASVTEYSSDDATDMFQIGRMPCRQNDVVIPGPRVGASGTISRFAARILCRRDAPYDCRLYAGGFDAGRKMTTAGHALKRCAGCAQWLKRVSSDHACVHKLMDDAFHESNSKQQARVTKPNTDTDGSSASSGVLDLDHIEMPVDDPAQLPVDGLTKNGVRVWLPHEKQWFEVSVNGNLYAIAPRTPSVASLTGRNATVDPDTSVRHSAFNRPTGGVVANVPALLTDGAIIDLGGVQLQFQAPRQADPVSPQQQFNGASHAQGEQLQDETFGGKASETVDASVASKMDKLHVHCPVQLHPLRFDRGASEQEIESDQVPFVFPACGHVFGFDSRIARGKLCPLCRTSGHFVQLRLKENFQLVAPAERTAVPECVFNPCGHAISSALATHYAGLVMPNGRAICPFCAVHLDATTPFAKLFLFSATEFFSDVETTTSTATTASTK